MSIWVIRPLLVGAALWFLLDAAAPQQPKYFGLVSARCAVEGDQISDCVLESGKTLTDVIREERSLYDSKDCGSDDPD
jgi:hypothetical protein